MSDVVDLTTCQQNPDGTGEFCTSIFPRKDYPGPCAKCKLLSLHKPDSIDYQRILVSTFIGLTSFKAMMNAGTAGLESMRRLWSVCTAHV
ncbi:hypothetical protein OF83DRAFT_895068 [Amylostereum chailletii]|nr:hypothetical protein OF83DRAFT_895068 [Amylostereum chailletii]